MEAVSTQYATQSTTNAVNGGAGVQAPPGLSDFEWMLWQMSHAGGTSSQTTPLMQPLQSLLPDQPHMAQDVVASTSVPTNGLPLPDAVDSSSLIESDALSLETEEVASTTLLPWNQNPTSLPQEPSMTESILEKGANHMEREDHHSSMALMATHGHSLSHAEAETLNVKNNDNHVDHDHVDHGISQMSDPSFQTPLRSQSLSHDRNPQPLNGQRGLFSGNGESMHTGQKPTTPESMSHEGVSPMAMSETLEQAKEVSLQGAPIWQSTRMTDTATSNSTTYQPQVGATETEGSLAMGGRDGFQQSADQRGSHQEEKRSDLAMNAMQQRESALESRLQAEDFSRLLGESEESDAVSVRQERGGAQLTPIQQPLRHPQWSQEMAKRVQFMANQQLQQASIALNPENLGPIHLQLELDEQQQASLTITTRHDMTESVLKENMGVLKSHLDQLGIDLANTSFQQAEDSGDQPDSPQQSADSFFQLAGDGADGIDESVALNKPRQSSTDLTQGLSLYI